MIRTLFGTSALFAATCAGAIFAAEYPIGMPQEGGGLEGAAVYLQPIVMEPAGMMTPPTETDIHLEADIHALGGNPNGLAEGEWVPYLQIGFALSKAASDWAAEGYLMPMLANDGPHFGDNVQLNGTGEYHLALKVAPPDGTALGRHTDPQTGWPPGSTALAKAMTLRMTGLARRAFTDSRAQGRS
ncbi:MAG: iron transporter [Paracoccaceae bacterium]